MKNGKQTPVYIRLNQEDYDRIKSQAKEENMSVPGLCRDIILNRYPEYRDIRNVIEDNAVLLTEIQNRINYQAKGILESIKFSLRASIIAELLSSKLLKKEDYEDLKKRLEALMKDSIR